MQWVKSRPKGPEAPSMVGMKGVHSLPWKLRNDCFFPLTLTTLPMICGSYFQVFPMDVFLELFSHV